MKLYSGPLSLFTAKTRIVLAEKGLAYERIEVGWSRKDRYLPHHPDVVAINPKRQVPCLVDGDVTLYDSSVINEYLDERYPTPRLMPTDPGARARCRLLELECDEVFFPFVWELIDTSFYPAGADAARVAAALEGATAYYRKLERELAGREWLGGNFSLPDVGFAVMIFAGSTLGAPVPASLPALTGWLQRVTARPAVASEIAAMTAVVAAA